MPKEGDAAGSFYCATLETTSADRAGTVTAVRQWEGWPSLAEAGESVFTGYSSVEAAAVGAAAFSSERARGEEYGYDI